MPAFFAQRRGTVARVTGLRGGAPMPFRIKMDGIDIASDHQSSRAIITQCGIARNGNIQFLHTIGEAIYAYVFGERIGELRVSGVAFSGMCGGETTGMQQVLDTYEEKRASKTGRPLTVNFGDTPFTGYLTGMQLEVSDAETQVGQWTYRFNTFPGR